MLKKRSLLAPLALPLAALLVSAVEADHHEEDAKKGGLRTVRMHEDGDGQDAASKKPYLGVTISDEDGRVRVMEVMPDTAAARAGLEPGDRVLVIAGDEVSSYGDLTGSLGSFHPGDEVKIVVQRDGEEQVFEVELGSRPGNSFVTVFPDGSVEVLDEDDPDVQWDVHEAHEQFGEQWQKQLHEHLQGMRLHLDKGMEDLHLSLKGLGAENADAREAMREARRQLESWHGQQGEVMEKAYAEAMRALEKAQPKIREHVRRQARRTPQGLRWFQGHGNGHGDEDGNVFFWRSDDDEDGDGNRFFWHSDEDDEDRGDRKRRVYAFGPDGFFERGQAQGESRGKSQGEVRELRETVRDLRDEVRELKQELRELRKELRRR